MGRKGGTDWADGAASSCCRGEVPFAALRVVLVYDIVLYHFILCMPHTVP